MPIQTDNVMDVNSRQELIAAVALLEVNDPVTIVLHRPSGGITIYHFSYTPEFFLRREMTLEDRVSNLQKQIRKIPRQAFL
jgi:hypothetical protein